MKGSSDARTIDTPDTPVPAVALLGNGGYTVMLTAAGGGASRYGAMMINRWRNDGTRDAHGQWCYLKNVATGETWSAGHNPVAAPSASYAAELSGTCARIRRRDGAIETLTEVVVLPDDTGEARRVSVTNHSREAVTLEITTYQEVVLASAVSDRGHRAFGNLFVQTEWLADSNAILAMRRPRSAADKPSWCGHALATDAAVVVSCETDRARFTGRGRSLRNPVAMDNHGNLSGSAGAVLDPVLALRAGVTAGPGETVRYVFSTFVGESRDAALDRARACSDLPGIQKAIAKALDRGDAAARDLGLSGSRAAELQLLSSELIYGSGRIPTGTRDDLLAIGPSGDFPIVLTRLDDGAGLDAVKPLLEMHAYLARKGIACDVVILSRNGAVGRQLRETMQEEKGVFVVEAGAASQRAADLLDSVARLRLRFRNGAIEKLA